MGVLRAIGVVLIVAWLVLWLFVKITFAAIHLLVLIGIAMLLFGFLKRGIQHLDRQKLFAEAAKRARGIGEVDLQDPVAALALGIRLAQVDGIAVAD